MNIKGLPYKTSDGKSVCVRLPANLLEMLQELDSAEHKSNTVNDPVMAQPIAVMLQDRVK